MLVAKAHAPSLRVDYPHTIIFRCRACCRRNLITPRLLTPSDSEHKEEKKVTHVFPVQLLPIRQNIKIRTRHCKFFPSAFTNIYALRPRSWFHNAYAPRNKKYGHNTAKHSVTPTRYNTLLGGRTPLSSDTSSSPFRHLITPYTMATTAHTPSPKM